MSTAFQPVPQTSLVAGRYRPLRPLGSGGSGSVWLARDEQSGLEVALKIVPKEGKAASRAEREAQAAARLRHPHVLRAYGFGSDSDHVYIPYEYVPGHTLRVAMRARDLDESGCLEAAAQVLDALAHAHAHGIVHRDVKPSNVLVANGPEVCVRLLDFGLAQLADAETLTAVGDVPGTLAYISPERLRGEPAGPAADVWAVGVLVWEALTGSHPFFHESPVETGKQIQAGAPSIASARPDLPAQLVAAVDAALALDPRRRPTAAAFARALRRRWADDPCPAPDRRQRAVAVPGLRGAGFPALAALFAATVTAALPFFPPRWPLLLAAAAAALAALRPRAGLAFALAVPVFPLGNVSLGLALLYGVVALGWLVLAWPKPRSGLLFATGAVLAPFGALALLPLAVRGVPGWFRRGAYAGGAVLVAGVAAGLRESALPFTGGAKAVPLGIEGAESPLAAAAAVREALGAAPALGLAALVLAAAAALLPYAAARGELAIAGFAGALIVSLTAAAPDASPWPSIGCGLVTCVVLCARWRRAGGEATRLDDLGTLLRTTRASFGARLKPVGGPWRPRTERFAPAVRR